MNTSCVSIYFINLSTIFKISLMSFNNALLFLMYKSYTLLVKVVAKCLNLNAVVNKIVFWILFMDYSLLVYKITSNICIFVYLYFYHLLNSFIMSNSSPPHTSSPQDTASFFTKAVPPHSHFQWVVPSICHSRIHSNYTYSTSALWLGGSGRAGAPTHASLPARLPPWVRSYPYVASPPE